MNGRVSLVEEGGALVVHVVEGLLAQLHLVEQLNVEVMLYTQRPQSQQFQIQNTKGNDHR